jgi:hypothetical protein
MHPLNIADFAYIGFQEDIPKAFFEISKLLQVDLKVLSANKAPVPPPLSEIISDELLSRIMYLNQQDYASYAEARSRFGI